MDCFFSLRRKSSETGGISVLLLGVDAASGVVVPVLSGY